VLYRLCLSPGLSGFALRVAWRPGFRLAGFASAPGLASSVSKSQDAAAALPERPGCHDTFQEPWTELEVMFLMRPGQPPVPAAGCLTITPLDGQTGLRLASEADLHTVPALRRSVAEPRAGAREVHLQAVGPEFFDVAAARLLITLTGRPGHPAVIVQDAPPLLIRLIRVPCPALARSPVRRARSRRLASWRRASSWSLRQAARGRSIPRRRDWTAGGQS
jgi:hypothetical protein